MISFFFFRDSLRQNQKHICFLSLVVVFINLDRFGTSSRVGGNGREDVCLLANIMEQDGTLLMVFKVQKKYI